MVSSQLQTLYKMADYSTKEELNESATKTVFRHLTQCISTRSWIKTSKHP